MSFDRLVEQRIQEAQAQGKFDGLAGFGRPLDLGVDDENDEAWAAHRLLQAHGLRPAWLEEDLALRQALDQARRSCRRSWEQFEAAGGRETAGWLRAQDQFRLAIAGLNRRRWALNLRLPSPRLQRLPIDPELELRRLTAP